MHALLGAVLIFATSSTRAADSLQLLVRLDHPELTEISGLTSASMQDTYWLHNDSGDAARLFAINRSGTVLLPPYLASRYQTQAWPGLQILNAWNVDWEDLTRATDGTLYITDMGNNGNARRDLGIYVLPEPNPLAIAETRALTFLPVAYPDQQRFPASVWHFDCEAVFYSNDKLYLLTKHRKPGEITGWESGSKLYRLDTQYTDRTNVLTLVGESDELALATAADLSPDGQHLAVLTYRGVWLFRRPAEGDNWLSGESRFISLSREQLKTSEALTWQDSQSLLIANEEAELLQLDVAELP
jgi:hypothetical protein